MQNVYMTGRLKKCCSSKIDGIVRKCFCLCVYTCTRAVRLCHDFWVTAGYNWRLKFSRLCIIHIKHPKLIPKSISNLTLYCAQVKLQVICTTRNGLVKCQVLTVASMEMAIFWVVAPWSLALVLQSFRRACYFLLQGDKRRKTSTILLGATTQR